VPDYRGRTPIGDGTGPGLSARTLGQQVGAETHTLTASEGAVGSHSHTIGTATNGGSDLLIGWGNWSFGGNNWATQIANPGNGNSYARTTSSNASSAHNNMQPSLVCKFGIKY
jgi:microcystin-dependent protein